MKMRFSDEQIISILREADAGVAAREICRKHAISDATSTPGARSLEVWKLSAWSRLRKRTPDSGSCLMAGDRIITSAVYILRWTTRLRLNLRFGEKEANKQTNSLLLFIWVMFECAEKLLGTFFIEFSYCEIWRHSKRVWWSQFNLRLHP